MTDKKEELKRPEKKRYALDLNTGWGSKGDAYCAGYSKALAEDRAYHNQEMKKRKSISVAKIADAIHVFFDMPNSYKAQDGLDKRSRKHIIINCNTPHKLATEIKQAIEEGE